MQSRVNGQLAAAIDDPYTAAPISFGSGLVILLVVLCVLATRSRGRRAGARRTARGARIAWWMVLGGLAGAWFVATQGLSAGVLGVALFTVAIVAGQTIGGIVFDLVGLGPGGRRPLTIMRVLGALLALGGDRLGRLGAARARRAAAAHAAAVHRRRRRRLAAGGERPGEGRGRQRAHRDAVQLRRGHRGARHRGARARRHPRAGRRSLPTEPWLYVGGAIGCMFIAGQAVLVRVVGVLLLALCGVAGQLAAALALDLLLPTSERPIDLATIGGTVLAVVAVVVASIRWTRHKHVADAPAERRGRQSSELKFGARGRAVRGARVASGIPPT